MNKPDPITPQRPPDPLIDEIREIRRDLSEQFNNDPAELAKHLHEIEREFADRVRRPVSRAT